MPLGQWQRQLIRWKYKIYYICRINLIPKDYLKSDQRNAMNCYCFEITMAIVQLVWGLRPGPGIIIAIYSALLFIGCYKWNPLGNKVLKHIYGKNSHTYTHSHAHSSAFNMNAHNAYWNTVKNVYKAANKSDWKAMHNGATNNRQW